MPGLVSTSIAAELGRPITVDATDAVARAVPPFARALARRLEATLAGDLPPDADPAAELTSLERLAGAVPA